MFKRFPRMFSPPARLLIGIGVLFGFVATTDAQEPSPRLNVIFPPGGQVGTSFEMRVGGSALDGLSGLICDEPRVTATPLGNQKFRLHIPNDVPPGLYDVRARGDRGLSSPRSILVGVRETVSEIENSETPQNIKRDVSINGLIEVPGDVDVYRFHARAGQRVVLDCWAERLDSKLRAVLELEDDKGRRLAASRGYTCLDPLIDCRLPVEGDYVIRVFDLTYSGSPEHVYRLDIDSGPRIEFAWPNVVERGKPARVSLLGRNLVNSSEDGTSLALDRRVVDLPPTSAASEPKRVFSRPARFGVEEFAYDLQNAAGPVLIGLTDVPVEMDVDTNHQPDAAQEILWPKEICGRLETGDEKDWFRLKARCGEVLWLEAFGERLGSPVDLDLAVYDVLGQHKLAEFNDSLEANGTDSVRSNHTDPAGRWVAPADGSYLVLVRNVIGGSGRDPQRVYRLSIRREEPDFQLLAIPGGERDTGVCNIARSGRGFIDLRVLRRRGLSAPILVKASGLPSGLECPDVWIGPEMDHVPEVVTASPNCEVLVSELKLTGHAKVGTTELVREARGATTIPTLSAMPSARLTGKIMVGVVDDRSWSLSASPSRTVVSQGSVIDLAVTSEIPKGFKTGPVELLGLGVPGDGGDRLGVIPSSRSKGWYCIQVPERLTPGPYTFAVRGETTLTRPAQKPGANPTQVATVAVSNPISIEVVPGAFDIRLDPHNPSKIRRGQVIQIHYKALRRNGFIGKIHTELSAPEGVAGLRARGVTFVGQTDAGSLQVVASDDSPLGRQPFLRLEGVGTVEDEPVHQAACFLDLEITE